MLILYFFLFYQIRCSQAKSPENKGILLLACVLIAISIATLLVSLGVFDARITMINFDHTDLLREYAPQSLPSIVLTGKSIINGIIMVNLVLAWIILDRVIMKPFFQRRIQSNA